MAYFTFYLQVQGENDGRLNVWLSLTSVADFKPFILFLFLLGAALHIISSYFCYTDFLQRLKKPGCNQATSVPVESTSSRIAS